MATKRNPKQEAKAAAEKALAAAAKKQAAVDAKAAALEKKAAAAKRKTAAAKEKAVCESKTAADVAPPSAKEPAAAQTQAAYSAKYSSNARAVSGANPSAAPRTSRKKRAAATPSASERAPEEAGSRSAKRRRWPLWTAAVVVAVLLLAAAGLSWDRWLRYDDAADFQGAWYLADSAKAIAIDDAAIKLTDDVAFSYQIDPLAKTISFTFGNKANTGRYRFSADRKQLIVVEGSSYTTLSTLFDDIALAWENLTRGVRGEQPVQPEAGNGTTVFQREKTASHAPVGIEAPAVKAPASEAPAASEPAVTPSTDAGKSKDAPAGSTADEQKSAAEPGKADEQKTGSSTLPGTMFDGVADQ
ncbi:MAG: hypothetical protein RR178_06510 [Gordonibacter sp.]